jgi:hypothetical protein
MTHDPRSAQSSIEPSAESGRPRSVIRLHASLPLMVHVESVIEKRHLPSATHGVLSLTGSVRLHGLRAEVVFRTRPDENSPPTRESRASAIIIPAGQSISISPQRLYLTGREEPELWLLVSESLPPPWWSEYRIGYCNGQPLLFDRQVALWATLDAHFTIACNPDGPGIRVEVGGELRFDHGVRAKLVLRDTARGYFPAQEAAGFDVALLPAGAAVTIRPQTMWGLIEPPQWISVRMIEAGGRVVRGEHRLGRCEGVG